jgi:hypothetical protein
MAVACRGPFVAAEPLPRFDPKHIVRLNNGLNWIDLDGDGTRDLVLKAHYRNHNAHSFDTFTFIRAPGGGKTEYRADTEWETVPIEDSDGALAALHVSTSQGADCRLRDIRLIVSPDPRRVYLIIGHRKLKDSYYERQAVQFAVYQFVHEPDGIPGVPEWAFREIGKIDAVRQYCDVNRAFFEELNLPDRDPEDLPPEPEPR